MNCLKRWGKSSVTSNVFFEGFLGDGRWGSTIFVNLQPTTCVLSDFVFQCGSHPGRFMGFLEQLFLKAFLGDYFKNSILTPGTWWQDLMVSYKFLPSWIIRFIQALWRHLCIIVCKYLWCLARFGTIYTI